MTTYFVSSIVGSDSSGGTSSSDPLATLQAAESLVKPGDTVEIMNGTYTGGAPGGGDVLDITTSGTASAPITFEAAPGATPVINSSGGWNAIKVEASYIVINGLTIEGDAANYTLAQALAGYSTGNPSLDGNGIAIIPGGSTTLPNHVTIENTTVFNEPGGGIYTEGADYVQILNNTVYDNAHWSAYGNSGISISTSANLDTAAGAHIVVSGNTVYGNSQEVPTIGNSVVTDGEGIILDTNPNYTSEILVSDNNVHNNGSSGIEAYLTNGAVITGNNIYGNDALNVQALIDAAVFVNQSNDVTVTDNTSQACFASGTRIQTSRGDVVVEELQIGDFVVTAGMQPRPIRWIGHRRVHCRRYPRPHEVMPICIAAHAFGPSRPARDLYVSPGHAICVDVVGETLIPASELVNGATIQQVDVEEVTYWHVELESHDILMAENLPAESYFDTGNRVFFAESGLVQLQVAPENAGRAQENFCRPFHDKGALVDVVRLQLEARARSLGWTLQPGGAADLHLLVDGRRVDPILSGRRACFQLGRGASDVWLVSSTARPIDVGRGADRRRLGVCVSKLYVGADLTQEREIRLDNPILDVGFHEVERDGDRMWRWAAGRTPLPAALLAEPSERVVLTVELRGEMLPRWVVLSDETVKADAKVAMSA